MHQITHILVNTHTHTLVYHVDFSATLSAQICGKDWWTHLHMDIHPHRTLTPQATRHHNKPDESLCLQTEAFVQHKSI